MYWGDVAAVAMGWWQGVLGGSGGGCGRVVARVGRDLARVCLGGMMG